jgi:hypothetical protein
VVSSILTGVPAGERQARVPPGAVGDAGPPGRCVREQLGEQCVHLLLPFGQHRQQAVRIRFGHGGLGRGRGLLQPLADPLRIGHQERLPERPRPGLTPTADVLACSKHRPIRLHQQGSAEDLGVLQVHLGADDGDDGQVVDHDRTAPIRGGDRADQLRLGRDVRRLDPDPTARGIVRDLHLRLDQGTVQGELGHQLLRLTGQGFRLLRELGRLRLREQGADPRQHLRVTRYGGALPADRRTGQWVEPGQDRQGLEEAGQEEGMVQGEVAADARAGGPSGQAQLGEGLRYAEVGQLSEPPRVDGGGSVAPVFR